MAEITSQRATLAFFDNVIRSAWRTSEFATPGPVLPWWGMGAPHYDIDPVDFETWVPPSDALALFPDKPVDTLRRAIGERLCMGLLHAAARTVIFGRGNPPQGEYHRITPAEWQDWAHEIDHDFWSMGDTKVHMFDSTGYGQGLSRGTWFYDVRIDPVGLSKIGGVKGSVAAAPGFKDQPITPSGGRPANKYWEPLLIEMARQLYAGELQPKSQADVQRAMHDWLTKHGHSAGDTQVKGRARLLWEAIR